MISKRVFGKRFQEPSRADQSRADQSRDRKGAVLGHRRYGLAVVVLVICVCPATGQEDLWKGTTFATLDVRAPQITGALWLDLGAVESLYPIDRDGDTVYTDAELSQARHWAESYLNYAFLVMWQGRIQPITVYDLKLDKRRGRRGRYVKVGVKIKDYPPEAPIMLVSRLLNEFSAAPRCMALVKRNGRQEVFVLGRSDYYRSHPQPLPKVAGTFYRPPEQRGRFATAGYLHIEMLYAEPEGAFYLYVLEADRYTPRGIIAKPIKALIKERPSRRDHDRPGAASQPAQAAVTLEPRPLGVEKKGLSSRFVAAAPRWKGVEAFALDMTVRNGKDHWRVLFDFPAVAVLSEAAAQASRRYACSNLCLGVELRRASARCARCGAGLLEVHGATVPGVGRIGRHGGQMVAFGASATRVEALLSSRDEFRLYLTNAALDELDITGLSGSVALSTDQRYEETVVEIGLEPSESGTYLRAEIPETVAMPIRARCTLDVDDGTGPAQLDFFFHE